MEIVRKVWGHEEILVNEPLYCAKYLCIVKPHMCSVHFHNKKTETFVGVEGVTHVELFDWKSDGLHDEPHLVLKDVVVLRNMRTLTIPAGVPHRFRASTRRSRLLEVSTHHDDKDVVRLEESQ